MPITMRSNKLTCFTAGWLFAAIQLGGCMATNEPVMSGAEPSNDGNAALQNTVTVQLISDNPANPPTVLANRTIHAAPISSTTQTIARGTIAIDGLQSNIIGSTCNALLLEYPTLQNCSESQEANYQYGEVEASGVTDQNNSTTLVLDATRDYQLTVSSWRSDSDDTCGWTGATTLGAQQQHADIALLYFCQ